MLRVEHLNTGYGKKQVLYDISFEIKQGDIALLIGSNGSGKSTLLKAIYGLCKVWDGKVYLENEEITNCKTEYLLKKGIMYIPQKNNLFEQLTVKENLEISGMALNNKNLFKQRLELVNMQFPVLESKYKMHPMKLSGGERQLLTLAMATLHQPKIIIVDEPFTGLSPQNITFVIEILKVLNQKNGITLLIVEHRVKECSPIANRIIGLKLGKVFNNTIVNSNFEINQLNSVFI